MTSEHALLILLANVSRRKEYRLQGGLYLHFSISAVCHFSFYFPHTLHLHNLMIYQDKVKTKTEHPVKSDTVHLDCFEETSFKKSD